MGFRIGEALGQEGAIAEGLPPLGGQGTQGRSHGLGGEVGRGGLGRENKKAAVLDDQLEPGDALRGVPTDPSVPILERVAGGSPRQEGDGLGANLDHLPEEVSHRT